MEEKKLRKTWKRVTKYTDQPLITSLKGNVERWGPEPEVKRIRAITHKIPIDFYRTTQPSTEPLQHFLSSPTSLDRCLCRYIFMKLKSVFDGNVGYKHTTSSLHAGSSNFWPCNTLVWRCIRTAGMRKVVKDVLCEINIEEIEVEPCLDNSGCHRYGVHYAFREVSTGKKKGGKKCCVSKQRRIRIETGNLFYGSGGGRSTMLSPPRAWSTPPVTQRRTIGSERR